MSARDVDAARNHNNRRKHRFSNVNSVLSSKEVVARSNVKHVALSSNSQDHNNRPNSHAVSRSGSNVHPHRRLSVLRDR